MDPSYDPISFRPIINGSAGRAWEVEIRNHPDYTRKADVAAWVVEAPNAHPFWHSYAVILFHLRGVPSEPRPHKCFPTATHEFWVATLHPQRPRAEVIKSGDFPFLGGPIFASQLSHPSDAEAFGDVYRRVVSPVVSGALVPNPENFSVWTKNFGDWMVKKGNEK